MNITKEYYEILEKLKETINNSDFKVSDEMFKKEYLKSLLLSNQYSVKSLSILKDKSRTQNVKNKNIFNLIKNVYKKHQKENRIVLNSLDLFSQFYNEPRYIEELNNNIYKRITDRIITISKEISLISIINGYILL